MSEKNESTRSLQNNNIVIIIKNDVNHDDVHYLQLKTDQISFPIRFNMTNINGIKTSGHHLLSLLIFGLAHRLMWEGILFRQNLVVNRTNFVNFTVKDVCK
jgi:hypothetical protein